MELDQEVKALKRKLDKQKEEFNSQMKILKRKLDEQKEEFDSEVKFLNRKLDEEKEKFDSEVNAFKKKLEEKERKVDLSESKINYSIDILTTDCFEVISKFLDNKSALNLYQTSKSINRKLQMCVNFWKRLCKNENFDEKKALHENYDENEDEAQRMSWSGKKLHDVKISDDSTFWHKVFLRGIEMRRNILSGKFEMWRLFMMDQESLPVKKMSKETTQRELRSQHRNSAFNDHRRRVKIHSHCWNKDFMIVSQFTENQAFNDIFIWAWNDGHDPTFLYSYDLSNTYPTGISRTTFAWKKYLVLMPQTRNILDEMQLCSMIRVHDLSRNFELVGKYDFPEDGFRRHLKIHWNNKAEVDHLYQLGDQAMIICRTPRFHLFIFSLPNCDLLRTVALPENSKALPENPKRPLELDNLDQMFYIEDNTMMFMLSEDSSCNLYRSLLIVDLENFVKANKEIEMKVDDMFDFDEDFMVLTSAINKSKLACLMISGKIVIRNILTTSYSTITHVDSLIIPRPEQLLELDSAADIPDMCTNSNGDIIILRQFTNGRKIHCYNSKGDLLYSLEVDDPTLELEKKQDYLLMELDGNFLTVADQNRIVLWNSKTGKHFNTIVLPEHYNCRDDPVESADKWSRKGHRGISFCEEGIIIIHNQRNFPIAADVIKFW